MKQRVQPAVSARDTGSTTAHRHPDVARANPKLAGRTPQRTPRQLSGSQSASSVSAGIPGDRGAGPSVLFTWPHSLPHWAHPRETAPAGDPQPCDPQPCRRVLSRYRTDCGVVVHPHMRPLRPCFLLQALSSSSTEPRLFCRPQNVLGPADTNTVPSVRIPRLSSSHVYLTMKEF